MPICNRDCFHCPFPDCVDDGVDDSEIKAAKQRDIEAIGADAARSREAKREAYRKIMADPERAAAYKTSQQKYIKKNRDKLREYYHRYYTEHKEEYIAYQRAYRAQKKAEREKELCR